MIDKLKHTFAICAYKDSPYLEECINSLLEQKLQSKIIMVTATPSKFIFKLAKKYSIPLFERKGKPDIAHDWNFAIEKAETQFVTITHQDDIYEPDYSKRMSEAVDDNTIIYFTNYGELRGGKKFNDNKLLDIKRKLCFCLKDGKNKDSKFWRRRMLSLGSAICCPSVTLNIKKLGTSVFSHGLKSNLDWEAWEIISRLDGAFYYDSEILMYHRIHSESETSKIINCNSRGKEDLLMFKKFWITPFAKIINKFYSCSEKNNF